MSGTLAELLGQCLRAAGVQQVFGRPVPGVRSHPVADASLARALADADGRMGPGVGCALLDDGTLHLSCRPGAAPEPMPLTDPTLLPEVVARGADWAIGVGGPDAAAFVLELDLDAPAPAGAAPVAPPPLPAGELPDLRDVEGSILVFAGPGVVRRSAVEALRRLAAVANVGVSNTWGAKGVFPWDSPHHLGTVGLQARDYELGGFVGVGLIVGVGIDEDESPWARWALSPSVQIGPHMLDALADAWPKPPQREIPLPPLFSSLSAVCMPSYEAPQVPLHPGRAIIETKHALGPGDRVAADPGGALGMWVARAFPTSELGSVVVPATVAPDFAATAAVACASRPEPQRVIAITHEPESAVVEWGRSRGVEPVIVVWGDEGDVTRPEDVAPAIARGGVVRVPVDLSRTEELIAVAGEIVAWT
ncbi:MAG TPA: hypothetical protein VF183_00940 [Acidimicrobiales bacterium]